MNGSVTVDTNLLLLLVVGLTNSTYIAAHKRLRGDYRLGDLREVERVVAGFSEIVLVPHVLAEVSSLSRLIREPARSAIQRTFARLIEARTEVRVPSLDAVRRADFLGLGLTDAMLLHVCSMDPGGNGTTLFTGDQPLAARARALGISVRAYQSISRE